MTQLPFKLLSEEHYDEEMDRLLLRLDQLRQASGHCERKPGLGIYWEYYAPDEGCQRVVFISHGFTESTLEYSELIWYFLRAGYGVFICDHMGHGKSYRLLNERWLTHVTSFDEYIEDMHHLMDRVVLPRTEGKTRYLFGHSMGGAIAMLYLETVYARRPLLPDGRPGGGQFPRSGGQRAGELHVCHRTGRAPDSHPEAL